MKKTFLVSFIYIIISFSLVSTSFANSFNLSELYFENEKSFIVQINDKARINFFYEPQYELITKNISKQIEKTHLIYEKLLGKPNDFNLTIMVINQNDFFNITKVPNWVNAIYFKKHIVFPIDNNKKIDINFLKSIRHEYMHAFVNNLSKGKCANWLDEGLAQWAEGSTEPKLWQNLENFLKIHYALSINNLESGYTTLPTYLVPVAYAESLLGVKYLIRNNKLDNFKKLFFLLNNDVPFNESFEKSFNMSTASFDNKISEILYKYKNSEVKKSFDDLINYTKNDNLDDIMAKMK